MLGTYVGKDKTTTPVIILGYLGDKILIRTSKGGNPVWVKKEWIRV